MIEKLDIIEKEIPASSETETRYVFSQWGDTPDIDGNICQIKISEVILSAEEVESQAALWSDRLTMIQNADSSNQGEANTRIV